MIKKVLKSIGLLMIAGVWLAAPVMAQVAEQEGFIVEELADMARGPTALALAPPGSSTWTPGFLYVATYDQGYGTETSGIFEIIYRVSLADGTSNVFATLYPEADPVALEFSDSWLYIVSNNRDGGRTSPSPGDYGGTIQRVNADGNPLYGEDVTQIGLVNNWGLGDPVGMAFGPGGAYGTYLYVANSCDISADIFQVDLTNCDPSCSLLEFLDDGKDGHFCGSGDGYAPIDVAFGFSENKLYFTDQGEGCNCVQTIDASGSVVTWFANLPGRPHDLTFAPPGPFGGDLYVTVVTSGNGSIYRVTPGGTVTLFASGFERILRDSLEFSADGSVLYVADYDKKKVFTIKDATYACEGFEPPAESDLVVRNKNRALPLKARLVDSLGADVTDLDINVPPIHYCEPFGQTTSDTVEPTETLPAGAGSDGTEFWFDWDDMLWHFNLKVGNLSPNTKWTCYLVAGEGAPYWIEPNCSVVIEFDIKKK